MTRSQQATDSPNVALARHSVERLVRLRCEYVTLNQLGWTDGNFWFPEIETPFPLIEGATLEFRFKPNTELTDGYRRTGEPNQPKSERR